MRRLLLILAVGAVMAAMLGLLASPAFADHRDHRDHGDRFFFDEDLFDDDDDDAGFCILGTRDVDVLVPEETIFGTTDFDVVSLDVPCEDDDDDFDDIDVFDHPRFGDRFGDRFFVG